MVREHQLNKNPYTIWRKYKKEILDEMIRDGDEEDYKSMSSMIESVRYWMREYFKLKPLFLATRVEEYMELKTADFRFTGEADALGVMEDHQALYELKTKAKPGIDPVSERFRPQTLIYAWALERKGIEVTHIIREFIYTPTITLPSLTKKGAMSRANITCPWSLYKEKLEAAELDPNDYQEMEEKLAFTVRDKLVTRINHKVKEYFFTMLAYEAKQMEKEKMFPRCWSFDCNRCEFKDPCYMNLIGEDEDFMLRRDYRPKKSHYAIDNT